MNQHDAAVLDNECFQQFSLLVHKMTGITVRSDRLVMLSGRLRRRMRELKLESYESYLDYVKRNDNERTAFVNAVTTNETYFYRTPRIWEYLSGDFLPNWYKRNSGKTLKVWSAASSTGEEAHTTGILMQAFKDQHRGFDYQILGTDIAPRVVEHAKKGVYKGRAIERFRLAQPDLFKRYMRGDDEKGFVVSPDIKSRLRFDSFNLFDVDGKSPTHDLVLLRNVLIYFSKDDQKQVMANLHQSLMPEGIAIIGESETLNNLNTDFEPITATIYRAIDPLKQSRAA